MIARVRTWLYRRSLRRQIADALEQKADEYAIAAAIAALRGEL